LFIQIPDNIPIGGAGIFKSENGAAGMGRRWGGGGVSSFSSALVYPERIKGP
jgi:hypothetical protein